MAIDQLGNILIDQLVGVDLSHARLPLPAPPPPLPPLANAPARHQLLMSSLLLLHSNKLLHHHTSSFTSLCWQVEDLFTTKNKFFIFYFYQFSPNISNLSETFGRELPLMIFTTLPFVLLKLSWKCRVSVSFTSSTD